jgi:hypothetical protein
MRTLAETAPNCLVFVPGKEKTILATTIVEKVICNKGK